jgi:hypothetical protein
MDVLTRGRYVQARGEGDFVQGGSSGAIGPPSAGTSLNTGRLGAGAGAFALTEGERHKVDDGVLLALARRSRLRIPAVQLQTFLDSTCSRMAYHSLFALASLNMPLPPSADTKRQQHFALFRNAHLSVLYKHPAGALYTFTMDEVFLREPNVVWEGLEDVEQGGAVFADARFERSAAVGGDWAGWTPEADVPGVGATSECVCFRFLPFFICLIVLQPSAGTQAAGGRGHRGAGRACEACGVEAGSVHAARGAEAGSVYVARGAGAS